jgi:predicted porin
MKKSLIALAVLAASGAAMAQSSVQLYGIVDLVVHKDKGADTALTSGGVSGSRIGFKGTKDLGAGLKANFVLESGFTADDGAGFDAFGRQAYLGLAGGFGEVKLGKVWSAYDDVAGATNPVFDSVLAPTGIFASSGYLANPNNGVYFATPVFSGFSGAISSNFAEGGASKSSAVHGKYENGPLFAALAYQEDTAGVAKSKFTRLNASYDLGSVKLLAGVARLGGVLDGTEYTVGADIPLGANLVASVGFASSNTVFDNVGDFVGTGARESSLGAGVAYTLAKDVTVYGGIRKDTDSASSKALGHRVGAGLKVAF